MKTWMRSLVAGAYCLWILGAQALEIQGVTVEPTITMGGTKLVLNGAGVRYKAFFKINVTEIHAVKRFATLEELLALPGPKRVTITLLREIPFDQMGKSLTRGIEDNYPKGNRSGLIPSLIRISELFSDTKQLMPGDRVLIEWVPGIGTVLTVKGKVQGEPFKDPELFRAVMSIWLGPTPIDFKLKDALLTEPRI